MYDKCNIWKNLISWTLLNIFFWQEVLQGQNVFEQKGFQHLFYLMLWKIIKRSGLFIYRKKNETPYKKLDLNLEQKKVTFLPNANIELRSSWLAKIFKPNFKNQEKRNYTKRLVTGFYYSFSVTIAKIFNLDCRLRARE